jgi:hypothetical protein
MIPPPFERHGQLSIDHSQNDPAANNNHPLLFHGMFVPRSECRHQTLIGPPLQYFAQDIRLVP